MKLTTRLIRLFVAAIILVLAIDGYVAYRRDQELLASDLRERTLAVGLAMRTLAVNVWRESDPEHAERLVEESSSAELPTTIRWVWTDAPAGSPDGPRARIEGLDPDEDVRYVTLPSDEGAGTLLTYVPVEVPGGRPGAIEVAHPLDRLSEHVHSTGARSAILLVALVLVATLTVVVVGARVVGRPLEKLVAKIRRVGRGDLDGPLRLAGRDELAELGAAVETTRRSPTCPC